MYHSPLIENQQDKKLKILRTDNGLEFCNQEFDSFCRKEGVIRHRTCAYTPQQNGVAERMNRTIMNKVRCMLSESGLGKQFWAEAASTAVFLINKSPSSSIEFDIPEEKWTGHPPDYKILKKFGSVAYIHSDQGKLNPRAKKGIFLGYPDGVKGFKVWLLEDRKCVVSRDIVFQENQMYKELQKNDMSEEEKQLTEVERTLIELKNLSADDENQSEGGDKSNQEQASTTRSASKDKQVEETDSDDDCLENYLLARDRIRRQIRAPQRFVEEDDSLVGFALTMTEDGEVYEPETYEEAMRSPECEKWKQATIEEMDSMKKNDTWDVIDKPEGKRVIGCKWIFKRKAGIPGVEPPRYKARLVAKGFSQREGIDYQEIFSPVVKHVSIRYLLSIVVQFDMELEQLDVKTAFLHGNLDEYILMSQPEGYEDEDSTEKVCLLKKSQVTRETTDPRLEVK